MYEIIAWSTYVKALHTRYRILEVTTNKMGDLYFLVLIHYNDCMSLDGVLRY